MRLLKTAVLFLLFASQSQVCSSSDYSDTPSYGSKGKWSWSRNIATIAFKNRIILQVQFSREHQCDVAFFAIIGNDEIDSIAFNIDGKNFRGVNSETALQTENGMAMFPLSDSALRALKKGSSLRIDTDEGTLSSSLSGSAWSFNMAYANCMKAIEKTTLKPSQKTRSLPQTNDFKKEGNSKITTSPLGGITEAQRMSTYVQTQYDNNYAEGNDLFNNGYPRIAIEYYNEALVHAKNPQQRTMILEVIYKAAINSCRQDFAKNAIDKLSEIDSKKDWEQQLLQSSSNLSRKMSLNGCLNNLQQGRKVSPIQFESEGGRRIMDLLDRLEVFENEEQILDEEMTFYYIDECPYRGCERYILAVGTITEKTPGKFEAYLKEHPKSNVAFYSKGGDLAAGLELGLILRKSLINTQVGTFHGEGNMSLLSLENKENGDFFLLDSIGLFKEEPVCLSACAYAFLGGLERLVYDSATYGVHQFHAKDKMNEEEVQQVVGLVGAYLMKLGINRDLLQLALWTSHKEIWKLDRAQLEALDVITNKSQKGQWKIKADEQGEIFVSVTGVNSSRTNEKIIFTINRRDSAFVGVLTSHVGEKKQDRIEECVGPFESKLEEDEHVWIRIGENSFRFRYQYEYRSDGLQTVIFPISRIYVMFLSYGEKSVVSFHISSACRDFSMDLELPIEQQTNSMKALLH